MEVDARAAKEACHSGPTASVSVKHPVPTPSKKEVVLWGERAVRRASKGDKLVNGFQKVVYSVDSANGNLSHRQLQTAVWVTPYVPPLSTLLVAQNKKEIPQWLKRQIHARVKTILFKTPWEYGIERQLPGLLILLIPAFSRDPARQYPDCLIVLVKTQANVLAKKEQEKACSLFGTKCTNL
ncbi:hypothetical protein CPC08DRAFT_725057 [Agrocybe pediades]|nr:hypothetical protein CPC08DRAFT_725057 [Agrocybe pediades]